MEKIVCFIGHRKVEDVSLVRKKVSILVYRLLDQGIYCFAFGDHSDFDQICWEEITKIKEIENRIRRIHYRKDYPIIAEKDMSVFYHDYEDNRFAERAMGAGKASYIKRNQQMIEDSSICVFYFQKERRLPQRKTNRKDASLFQPQSGTALAFDYAEKKGKTIINLYDIDVF